MWHLLTRHSVFRRLWFAATVDALGSWLLVIAVPVRIYALTGSETSTGLALAVQALPAVLVGPWAGLATDRYSRWIILVVANLGGAAGVALLLAAATPGSVAFVYLGLLVENVAVCFLRPALQAAIPTVVDENNLAAANALLALSNSAWRILGPLLGTALTAVGWFPAVVLLDLASYLIAATVLATVPLTATAQSPTSTGIRANGVVRTGIRLIARTPQLRGLLACSCLYWTCNAALTALLVPFVTDRLHASERAVGYLVTGLGVGYLCGSALSRTLLVRCGARVVIATAYATVGLCFLVMFSAMSLPVALTAVTGSGLPGAAAMVATGYHVQVCTADHVRGRVFAAFQTSDAVAAVGGALAAPAVVALTSLGQGLVILSAALLVAAIVAAVLLPPSSSMSPPPPSSAQET